MYLLLHSCLHSWHYSPAGRWDGPALCCPQGSVPFCPPKIHSGGSLVSTPGKWEASGTGRRCWWLYHPGWELIVQQVVANVQPTDSQTLDGTQLELARGASELVGVQLQALQDNDGLLEGSESLWNQGVG